MEWIQLLTKHFEENQAVFSLFHYIQQNNPLIISTDGSKDKRRSGVNPNFSHISAIISYRAEVFISLAVTLFLHLYSIYYQPPVNNKINALCDNQSYANKST